MRVMDKDIVPGLLELIENEFDSEVLNSEEIKGAIKQLKAKRATYKEANDFAVELGVILAGVLGRNITAETLPNGKMYFNIADRIIEPAMSKNYELIAGYAADVQTQLNYNAGLRIKGQKAELNQSRIDGIIERLSQEEDFNEIKWILDEPIKNFSQNIVDDTIRTNAEFHAKAGLRPKIIRRSTGNCCDWCEEIAGVYEYPYVPEDVYRRHRFCRCTVDYYPGDGKRQNVHTKEWIDPEKDAKIEARKSLNRTAHINIDSKQFGRKAPKHMQDFGLDVSSLEDREKFQKIIMGIVENADSIVRDIEWRGQLNPVKAYVKGRDAVLVGKDSEFITILKGGADNARIKNKRK